MNGKMVKDKYGIGVEGKVVVEETDAVTVELTRSHRCAAIITMDGHVANEAMIAGDRISLRKYMVQEV